MPRPVLVHVHVHVLVHVLVLVLVLGACAGDGGPPTAVARFDPEAGTPLPFAAVPFPSELYRDASGTFAIGELPTSRTGDPLFVEMRALFAARDGFCATCNVYFGIDGPLDPATVPDSAAPGDTGQLGDPIVLVDVDAASPERGRVIPLRVQWDERAALLSVRPVRGIALAPGRRYAAAVTDALAAEDGSRLAASPAFRALRDGGDAVIGPTLDALDELGVPRERIVAVAPFTTGHPSAQLLAARRLVHAAPAPVARVDRTWAGTELDDLLGVPSEDRPGIDVPPAPATEGTRSIVHATIAIVVAGTFDAPRLVDGTGTDVGLLRRGPSGELVAGPMQPVPFMLAVPTGVDLARCPVVVLQHGFNASRTTGFALAETAARAGAAVLSIDAYQHGARAASATDTVNNMRGDLPGADGFSETVVLDVTARTFGLSAVTPGLELFPGYPVAAFTQFAADVWAAIRLVREGDLAAVRAADPMLAALAFDRDRVFYAGNSLGAVIGVSVLTAESDLAAAVLNVQPGPIIENFTDSPEFRALAQTVLLPLLHVTGPFDEQERELIFDPSFDLYRWALEPVDPLALAPTLFTAPVAEGVRPDTLFQVAEHDEVAAVTATESFLAAAGIPTFGTMTYATPPVATLPLQGNAGGITLGAVRFLGAGHGMYEVVDQESRFAPPRAPPLTPRDEALPIRNPIEDVHRQIEGLFRSRLGDGAATVIPVGSAG